MEIFKAGNKKAAKFTDGKKRKKENRYIGMRVYVRVSGVCVCVSVRTKDNRNVNKTMK